MERLTEKHYGANDYYMTCSEECERDNCVECADLEKIVNRLGAYEGTGLTPEGCAEYRKFEDEIIASGKTFGRLIELLKADKEGRVVVLPCKVGDFVYGFHNGQTILPMVAKWIETNTDGWCVATQYAPMAPRFYQFSDFGKTVFLTREGAEKALEAMMDGD